LGSRLRFGLEPTEHAGEKSRLRGSACDRRRCFLTFGFDRRLTGRNDCADCRLLGFCTWLGNLWRRHCDERRRALIARHDFIRNIRAANALDFEMRRLELFVGNDDDRHLVPCLDLDDALALFVEQEVRNGGRNLHEHLSGVFLHRLFFDQAQHRQRQRFDAAHAAMAFAARAHGLARLAETRAQALA